MKRLLHVLPVMLGLAIWIGFARPAHAAAVSARDEQTYPGDTGDSTSGEVAAMNEYGITCATASCKVAVPLDLSPLTKAGARFAVHTVQENFNLLPEGSGIELNDSLVIEFPIGEMALTGADLTLVRAEDGSIDGFRGTAQVPVTGLEIFENIAGRGPLMADVGYGNGLELVEFNAPLIPDRNYVFFNFGAGLDMTDEPSKLEGESGQIPLTLAKGQRATLIVDTEEPFAYLSGNLTLAYDEQLALVGDWMNAIDAATLINGVPIRHSIGVEWTGAIGDNQPAFLRLGGSYSADAGMVGRWLNVDLTPLTAYAVMTLNGDGMLLDGVVAADIMPETLFDGAVYTQVFVPFEAGLSEAYVKLTAEASVPSARTTLAGAAELHGNLDITANASMTTPFYDNDGLVLLENDGDRARQRFGYVRSLAEDAGDTVTHSYVFVRSASGSGANWLKEGAVTGLQAVGDTTASSLTWTQKRWCGMTGLCADGEARLDALAAAGELAE